MDNDAVPFLEHDRHVILAFADRNLLTKYVMATYRFSSPAPLESDQSIVTLDISLPSEIIERLTRSADSIDVGLMWTPPIWNDRPLRFSLMLLGCTLLLAAVSRFSIVRFVGAASFQATRLLLPVLWLCMPTEAIARHAPPANPPPVTVDADGVRLHLDRGRARLLWMETAERRHVPAVSKRPMASL